MSISPLTSSSSISDVESLAEARRRVGHVGVIAVMIDGRWPKVDTSPSLSLRSRDEGRRCKPKQSLIESARLMRAHFAVTRGERRHILA